MTFMEGVEDAAGQPVLTSMGTFQTPKRKPQTQKSNQKTINSTQKQKKQNQPKKTTQKIIKKTHQKNKKKGDKRKIK